MIIYVFVSKHINKISDDTGIYFKLIVLRVKQITKRLVLKLTVHNSDLNWQGNQLNQNF